MLKLKIQFLIFCHVKAENSAAITPVFNVTATDLPGSHQQLITKY